MSDQKISQLSDGGASQATDEYVVARSGANYRIDGASVAAAATSVGTLSSLTVSGDLTVDTSTLKVDSTNNRVGIGTASPATRLDVSDTATVLRLRSTSGTATDAPRLRFFHDTNDEFVIAGGDGLQFYGSGTNLRMTLTGSGNLGLGVTPSASSTGTYEKSFEIGAIGNTIHALGSSNIDIASNAYYNSGWKYAWSSASAARYTQQDGQHRFFNAASGTAGNAITFTQAMTLDASGNLGVGTTSPDRRIDVEESVAGQAGIRVNNTSSANSSGVETVVELYNATTAMARVSSFRDSNELRVNNIVSGITSFYTNNTERARITSGGYFKASDNGTYFSSTGAYHELRQTANDMGLRLTSTVAGYTSFLVYGNTSTAAGTGFDMLNFEANGVGQFRVRGDGTIFAQNTTVQSISDSRLKENVSTATEGLDVITALRPVRYDWKAGYGNDRKNQLGFIAQEVEAVFPEAVSEWAMDEPTGEVDEDGNPITEKVDYKTVGPGALIPVLVKAIQELEARIAALEA